MPVALIKWFINSPAWVNCSSLPTQRKAPRTNSKINNFEYLIKAKIQGRERRQPRVSTVYRTKIYTFYRCKSLSCGKLVLYPITPFVSQHSSPSLQSPPLDTFHYSSSTSIPALYAVVLWVCRCPVGPLEINAAAIPVNGQRIFMCLTIKDWQKEWKLGRLVLS